MCTFWLAHALALAGDLDEATEVISTAARAGNDLGLMAEQVDPETGELFGNFPQAFSHVGLANAAHAIAQGREGHPLAAEGSGPDRAPPIRPIQ